MKGGRRPPGPTPEEWLDNLPIYVEGQTQDGLGLYAGEIEGVSNVLVLIQNNMLYILKPWEGTGHYYFDLGENEVRVTQVEGIAAWKIVQAAGLQVVENGTTIEYNLPTRSNIKYKLMDA